jgi:16S rRNA (adenine1518-N6/adenine1519-N6)-dimethyltransferase
MAFSMRRKTLVNNLGSIADKKLLAETLVSLNIKPNARAEELSTEQFIVLAEKLNITEN